MSNTFLLYLSQTRSYWRFRTAFLRILFPLKKFIFKGRYGIKVEANNYKSLSNVFSITQIPLFLAIGVAIILQYLDPHLYFFFQKIGLKIPDDGDYVTFLAAISSICCVFIALYYTGISAVGGAIYSRVPNNIRGLLVHDRFGNVYMRYLSFLAFLCLVLIALHLIGYSRIYLAIPLVTLAAGIGIFAFVKLGKRAFNLFDPTTLSGHIFEQMQLHLSAVTVEGYQWMNSAFQNYAFKQASAALDTLETLVEITSKEPHLNGVPFTELSSNVLGFMIFYERIKRTIPTESYWYEQKYQQKNWYRTEYLSVSMAHQTGTLIQPNVIRNHEWVEDRVIKIIIKCIEVNLVSAKYSELQNLFSAIDEYVKCLAFEGQINRAFSLLDVITSTVISSIANESSTGTEKTEILEKLATVESLACFPISIALGYQKYLENFNLHNLESQINCIRWDTDAGIYNAEFPIYYLSQLEWFKPRLAFEKEIEGHQITQNWYIFELILKTEAEKFVSNIESLISTAINYFTSIIGSTIQKHPWLAASVMSREWEYWHKIERQMQTWSKNWAELTPQQKIGELIWPTLDIKALQTKSINRKFDLIATMSQQSTLLALVDCPDGFPDYVGQFLHASGEAALDALLTNDIHLLKKVFTPYIWGCFICFNNLRPKPDSTDRLKQYEFKIASAALVDLMDISGYAKLLADYYDNNELWDVVTKAWDKYLESYKPQLTLPILSAAVVFANVPFEIAHRGDLRTMWGQKINHRLADIPRHNDYSQNYFGSEKIIDHESALIRVFATNPFSCYNSGVDVFVAFYIQHLENAKNFEFEDGWRDLLNSVERENKNKIKAMQNI